MKKSKFTEEQIAIALKQAELGTPVDQVCRKMGISDATFCNWRKKYGGLGPSEVRREGWRDNCKRVCRLYRAGGLSLRHCRPRRNKSARLRQPKQWVGAVNEI